MPRNTHFLWATRFFLSEPGLANEILGWVVAKDFLNFWPKSQAEGSVTELPLKNEK